MVLLSQCIKNFPINMFAAIMGLSGLTIAYQRAAHVFVYPWLSGIAGVMIVLVSAIMVIFVLIVFVKTAQAGYQGKICVLED